MWVDEVVAITNPAVLASTPVSLSPGPLGIGNATASDPSDGDAGGTSPPNYHFPLPPGVATAPVALVESDDFVHDQARCSPPTISIASRSACRR